MVRCLYHHQTEARAVEAEVRQFLADGMDERRWGLPALSLSVGNHSTTPLLEIVLVICR
jgi:aminopeptidase-like protein